MDMLISFFQSDLRTATAILLAGLGLLVSEKSGVVNIGCEGMMLMGALFGVIGSQIFNSALMGGVVAIISGMVMALIFAVFTIVLDGNQTVVGMAINILGLGASTTIYRVVFGLNTSPPKISHFELIKLPFLSDIPVVGPILFIQSLPVYIGLLMVPVLYFILHKTDLGLKIRAVGEYPKACDTLGINVNRIRFGTVLFSGAMSGLAGCYVSLGILSFFTENMIAGRGFMALAAVVFGRYKAPGVMIAALLFGAGEALQYRLQAAGTGIPFQFLLMIPYLLTILALTGFIGKSNQPAASGKNYEGDC